MKLYIFLLFFILTNGIVCVVGQDFEEQKMLFNYAVDEFRTILNDLRRELKQCKLRSAKTHKNTENAAKASFIYDIRIDTFPGKCKTTILPKNCAEATTCTQRSGIYKILPKIFKGASFLVECDVKTEGGGWTLIQRRHDGSVDFFRNWIEYQRGFGEIAGEFFIGLEKLYALTNHDGPQELLVVLEDKNEKKQAKYNNFVVGGESELFELKRLGAYSGNAGDSLTHHLGAKFTTLDRDNDEFEGNCAVNYAGAWWHKNCHVSNLNGKYGGLHGQGVNWHSFRDYNVSIQNVKMMIRRRTF